MKYMHCFHNIHFPWTFWNYPFINMGFAFFNFRWFSLKYLLPEYQQWQWLGWAKARRCKFNPALPVGAGYSSHYLLLCSMHIKRKPDSEAGTHIQVRLKPAAGNSCEVSQGHREPLGPHLVSRRVHDVMQLTLEPEWELTTPHSSTWHACPRQEGSCCTKCPHFFLNHKKLILIPFSKNLLKCLT